MAFPTTSVITSFTGSDENPLSEGGAWSGPIQSGKNQLQRLSNAASWPACGTSEKQSYYVTGTFGPDSEAYATITTIPTSAGHGVSVWCRVQNPGNATTMAAYLGVWTNGTGWRIFRAHSGGTFVQVGSTTATPSPTAGEKIGLEAIGTALALKHYTGSSWVTQVAATDANISAGGYIGIEIVGSGVLDDFGGGMIGAAVANLDFSRFPKPKMRTAA